MGQIGRKIYYELSTGNIIVDTGERQGDVVDTTEAQDFQLYAALSKYSPSAVGVLNFAFGQDASNFAQYTYNSVDITKNPPVIVWGVPPQPTLSDTKTAKTAQLRTQYQQTIDGGFQISIGGTTITFGWQTSDQVHLSMLQQSVTLGIATMPVSYSDVNGNPVTIPNVATLSAIEIMANKFMFAQHSQVQNLITAVNNATDVASVNAIQWSPASY